MNTLLITLLIAFIIICLAIASLAIGWLITGKQKLKPGACGRDPNKSKDEDCGTGVNCQLCSKPKIKKEKGD